MTRLQIILASNSPRRQELLRGLGLSFSVMPSGYEEKPLDGVEPILQVKLWAEGKARWVAEGSGGVKGVILGADTVVVIDGDILGKPRDRDEAVQMLTRLSGRTHQVVTGLALAAGDQIQTAHEITQVTFRHLSADDIHRYVDTGEPLDKAGAYGIQGKGALLVEHLSGCYFNVVGLPLVRLDKMFRQLGLGLLELASANKDKVQTDVK